MTCFPVTSRKYRVNDLESVNKAQKIRLEQLSKQAPDVEVSKSEFYLYMDMAETGHQQI